MIDLVRFSTFVGCPMGDVVDINYPETRKFIVLLRRGFVEKGIRAVEVHTSKGDDVYHAEEVPDLLDDLVENPDKFFLEVDEAMFQEYNRQVSKRQAGRLIQLNTYREVRKFICWFRREHEKIGNSFAARLPFGEKRLIEYADLPELMAKVNANSDPFYLTRLENAVKEFMIIETRRAENITESSNDQ